MRTVIRLCPHTIPIEVTCGVTRDDHCPSLGHSLKPIFHCDAKHFALGPRVGLDPQHLNFALGIPMCWYLKMLKFALPPTRTVKFALPQTPTPNASRWNIGGVGSPTRGAGVGHVHFMLFGPISCPLGSQRERDFQWNIGLSGPVRNQEYTR